MQCIAVLLLLCVFSLFFAFLKHKWHVAILLLALTVFFARVISAGIVRFFIFLLRCFSFWSSNEHKLGDLSLVWNILPVFVFFLAGLLCFFLFYSFFAFVIRYKHRRLGPCRHFHTLFACPPMPNLSTARIPTIRVHPYTSGIACVTVASDQVCF